MRRQEEEEWTRADKGARERGRRAGMERDRLRRVVVVREALGTFIEGGLVMVRRRRVNGPIYGAGTEERRLSTLI